MDQVAEGVKTARAARDLSRRAGVEMPIVEEMYSILYEGRSAREASSISPMLPPTASAMLIAIFQV